MNHIELQEEYEKKLRHEMEECKEKLLKINEEFHHLKYRYTTISKILKCIDAHKNEKPKVVYRNILPNHNLKTRDREGNKSISWYIEINRVFKADHNKEIYRTISEIYDMINYDNRFDKSKKKTHCISLANALDRAVKTGKMSMHRDGKRKLYGWVNNTIQIVEELKNS